MLVVGIASPHKTTDVARRSSMIEEEDTLVIAMGDIPLIGDVMALWDKGRDTWEMSKVLRRPESEIARALRLGREYRRMNGGK